MEAKQRLPRRGLRRAHEVSRLEEELWILVYAQLQPRAAAQAKRQPKRKASHSVLTCSSSAASAPGA